MADVSGRQSRSVKLDLGLKILDGFLLGFGVFSAAISTQFKKAEKVSFSFKNVQRTYVDGNWLGRSLSGQIIDKGNPSAAIFFGRNPHRLLVIDSIITSNEFSISSEDSNQQGVSLDIPTIEAIVSRANAAVQVRTTSGFDVTFEGNKALTFAFTCLQMFIDPSGRISSLTPEMEQVLLSARGAVPRSNEYDILYSPDRVRLSKAPAMLIWDKLRG